MEGMPLAPDGAAAMDETSPACATAFPSFARVQRSVLQPRCVRCHDAGSELPLTTWDEVRRSLGEIRQAVFVDRTMPREGELKPAQSELLRSWLDGGGRREAWVKECVSQPLPPDPDPVPQPEPSAEPSVVPSNLPVVPVGYKAVRDQFLTPYCLSCHGNGHTAGRLALDTLEQVRARAKDIYWRTIVKKNMPTPRATAQPTDQERETFADWIERGMPE